MKSLVFLEHQGTELDRGSLGVLAKAVALAGEPVSAVVAGAGDLEELAAAAGKFGAAKVYLARARGARSAASRSRESMSWSGLRPVEATTPSCSRTRSWARTWRPAWPLVWMLGSTGTSSTWW